MRVDLEQISGHVVQNFRRDGEGLDALYCQSQSLVGDEASALSDIGCAMMKDIVSTACDELQLIYDRHQCCPFISMDSADVSQPAEIAQGFICALWWRA